MVVGRVFANDQEDVAEAGTPSWVEFCAEAGRHSSAALIKIAAADEIRKVKRRLRLLVARMGNLLEES